MKGALFMKNFMMRGVVLAALLSSLVLPASAAWSNTDSNNLASIKTYTSNIYTVLNQSSLGSRLSSIVTNTQNAANYLSTISTRIGSSNTWPTINGQLTKIIGQNSDSYSRLGDVRGYLLDIKTTVSNIYSKMGTGGGSADLTKVTIQIRSWPKALLWFRRLVRLKSKPMRHRHTWAISIRKLMMSSPRSFPWRINLL